MKKKRKEKKRKEEEKKRRRGKKEEEEREGRRRSSKGDWSNANINKQTSIIINLITTSRPQLSPATKEKERKPSVI